MKGKSQLKRVLALLLTFVVALGMLVVPASASTNEVRNLAGAAVTSYSANQGQDIWLRAVAPAGTSVASTNATGLTVSFPNGNQVPAGASYVWFIVAVAQNATTGTVNVNGVSLPITVTSAPWNPGLVASGESVTLGTNLQTIEIAQGATAPVALNISRGGAQAVNVTQTLVGGITASAATTPIVNESGEVNLTVPATAAVGSTHDIVFTASGTGVVTGTGTIRVVVTEGNGGGGILGDLNGDGYVNAIDLGILLENWGEAPFANPLADLNGDGVVNAIDLGILLENWS